MKRSSIPLGNFEADTVIQHGAAVYANQKMDP